MMTYYIARINSKESFLVGFSLTKISKTRHFVVRQYELAEMHKILSGNGGCRIVALYSLGGIGKT